MSLTPDSAGPNRVAYLTGEYPKVSHTFIQREAEGLRAAGIEVRTCSVRRVDPENLTGPEERAAEASTFYVLAAAKSPLKLLGDHLGWLARAPGRYLSALGLAWRTRPPGIKSLIYQAFYLGEAGVLAGELRRVKARHLHNHFADSSCTVAMLAARIAGIPYSFTMHGPTEFFEAHKWRLDVKIAEARFVACISHFCRSQLMIFAEPADWEKLVIVHCGVEPERYGGDLAPPSDDPDHTLALGGRAGVEEACDSATDGGRSSSKHLVFVGRMAAVKGVPVLLDAVARLHGEDPDVTLTLVGDGPDRGLIEARIAALGLDRVVTITGYLSQAEVADQLARADVFVLPSFAEGVPVVLMEAMASRLPVVTTRIAGIPELVEDGVSGFVVPPGDATSLASRLGDLLADPDLRVQMGAAGRAKVEAEFDIRAETAWLAEILRGKARGLRPAEATDGR